MAHDQMQTMLMFTGQAKEAIGFYTSLFDDSTIASAKELAIGWAVSGDDRPA